MSSSRVVFYRGLEGYVLVPRRDWDTPGISTAAPRCPLTRTAAVHSSHKLDPNRRESLQTQHEDHGNRELWTAYFADELADEDDNVPDGEYEASESSDNTALRPDEGCDGVDGVGGERALRPKGGCDKIGDRRDDRALRPISVYHPTGDSRETHHCGRR
jgi:hypothetical protein